MKHEVKVLATSDTNAAVAIGPKLLTLPTSKDFSVRELLDYQPQGEYIQLESGVGYGHKEFGVGAWRDDNLRKALQRLVKEGLIVQTIYATGNAGSRYRWITVREEVLAQLVSEGQAGGEY